MGLRSAEALARRAAKRGVTVEQQAKLISRRKSVGRAPHLLPHLQLLIHLSRRRNQRLPRQLQSHHPLVEKPAAAASSTDATAVAVGMPVWTLDSKPATANKKDAKNGELSAFFYTEPGRLL